MMNMVNANTPMTADHNTQTPPLRKLSELLGHCPAKNVLGTLDRDIASIAFDSRKVEPGGLFIAIHGYQEDGSRFIEDALRRGASAFITETEFDKLPGHHLAANGTTAIRVEDARLALSRVSAEFYRHPSRDLNLVGITGTNGKTTLTYILETLFKAAHQPTGVIGTINYRYGGVVRQASVTTPESLDINRMLRDMADQGIGTCFLEVSSHSLALKRVHEMTFRVGVFTNLSRDHLDFHGTMEAYANAKKELFRANNVKHRVINTDDPVGREILKESGVETLTTGIDHPADVKAEGCVLSEEGSHFTLQTPSGNREIFTHLLGNHNVYNLLSGAAAALFQGIPLDEIGQGMRSIDRIPGRFERLNQGQDFTVVVDYAHTGDALTNVLNAARAFTHGKVIVVFGCGGDRDRGKRPEMGRAAIAGSDFAVITSDNPRREQPERIIEDILKGLPPEAKENRDYAVIPDRAEAIAYAINRAEKGDFLLIAGKGHEDYQILPSGTIHFDDREIAGMALGKRLNHD
jgi:UDP-N-acetylmuramoyl-L-alanyl-D-glutamate--2,6-diaminopimelate ligase